ncbi:MAG: hypothetical protein IPM45_07810 [Acidimicrobiales bacterium]|nr:hypothetical protein [Acidimicrobiales bacterium]
MAETVVPETVVVTPAGESWFDPEVLVHDGSGWMAWQDGVGRIWLAELDLTDGLVGPEGPVLVASDAAPMLDTNNGPELGVDAQGISLWYTASTSEGLRAARVAVGIAGATVEWVTSAGYLSPLPSRRPDAPTTLVVALRRPPGFGTAVWFDESRPSQTADLVWLADRSGGDARWVVGTGLITVAGELGSGAAVELVDTGTGAIIEIGAAGDDVVENTYGWVDPDTGRVSVLAVVGGDEAVVWDVDAAGSVVERLRVASPDEDHPYLGSPEPFLVDGRPWVTLTAADRPATFPGRTDQQVWLVPLDGAAPLRCDDGATVTTTRVDPETIVTDDEVFVYYYAWDATTSQVHRCAVSTQTLGG